MYLIFLTLVNFFLISSQNNVDNLHWKRDVFATIKMGKDEKKDVLLYFTAKTCGPCKYIEKNIFTEKDVRESLKDFLLVKVTDDYENYVHPGPRYNKKVKEYFSVYGYPTFVILKHDGTSFSYNGGIRRKNGFMKILQYSPVN